MLPTCPVKGCLNFVARGSVSCEDCGWTGAVCREHKSSPPCKCPKKPVSVKKREKPVLEIEEEQPDHGKKRNRKGSSSSSSSSSGSDESVKPAPRKKGRPGLVSSKSMALAKTSPRMPCGRYPARGDLFPLPASLTPASAWHPGSVGVEYEISSIKLTYVKSKEPVKSKIIVYTGQDLNAESDSGHVELVSKPMTIQQVCITLDQNILSALKKQFQVMNGLVGDKGILSGDKNRFGSHSLSLKLPKQDIAEYAGEEGDQVLCVNAISAIEGTLQVSFSIELERIPDLLGCKYLKSGKFVTQVSGMFPEMPEESPEVFGLICLCNYYKNSLASCLPGDKDGPKQSLGLMCRTDFCTLYRLLEDEDRTKFGESVRIIFGEDLDKPLFPGGYNASPYKVRPEWSITCEEWIDSIIDPEAAAAAVRKRLLPAVRKSPVDKSDRSNAKSEIAKELRKAGWRKDWDKDLLSPPPFFACDSDAIFLYAMGRYKDADGRVLVEVRQMHGAQPMKGFTLPQAWEKTIDIVQEMFLIKDEGEK